jgi:hypothetical protein
MSAVNGFGCAKRRLGKIFFDLTTILLDFYVLLTVLLTIRYPWVRIDADRPALPDKAGKRFELPPFLPGARI